MTAGLAVFGAVAAGLPSAAGAAGERLPDGATIAGVPLGGLGPRGATQELQRMLGPHFERPLVIRVGSRDRRLATRDAGLSIDYNGMVGDAFKLAATGRAVHVRLARSISSARLSSGIRQVSRPFYRAPRNARVRFGVTRVVRIHGRDGRGLDTARLRAAVLAELRTPTDGRVVKASVHTVHPAVTVRKLARVYSTYISIDRGTFKLRLFKRLRVVRTYPVAVGRAGFDTPSGVKHVLYKQVNPPWDVPNRPWAGSLAGTTVPPGSPLNPLKARFIALGNGVGIHGTAEDWSIGSRASHGCIRMHVRDVQLLYPRVPVGTPVLIR